MTDSEFIKAFIESGLGLQEWEDGWDTRPHRLIVDDDGRLACEHFCALDDAGNMGWAFLHSRYHDIANEIKCQLQEDCNKAGLDVRHWPGGFCVTNPDRMLNLYIYDWEVKEKNMHGDLTGKTHLETRYTFTGGETTTFLTYPEALIAACVAIQKEKE